MGDTFRNDSSLYPSLKSSYAAAASAPSTTAGESERWPLTASTMYAAQAPSYNGNYVSASYGQMPPVPPHRYQKPRLIVTTLKLMLFHFLNALLGVLAFVAVVSTIHVAFAFIPLCCVGLLVFRFVVVLVCWLAKQDVKLSNYIASPEEERVSLDSHDEIGTFVGLRLAPELSYFSPMSVLAALYFTTVKLVISSFSLVIVSIFAAPPLLLLALNNDNSDDIRIEFGHDEYRYKDFRENSFAFYVVWGCLFILSVVFLRLIAWLSRATTLFFCCEQITEPKYTIPIVQYPTTSTTTIYGSSISTRTDV